MGRRRQRGRSRRDSVVRSKWVGIQIISQALRRDQPRVRTVAVGKTGVAGILSAEWPSAGVEPDSEDE